MVHLRQALRTNVCTRTLSTVLVNFLSENIADFFTYYWTVIYCNIIVYQVTKNVQLQVHIFKLGTEVKSICFSLYIISEHSLKKRNPVHL